VVDKIAPTVNSYANKGLDTLEDKVPIITKQPEEVMFSVETVSCMYDLRWTVKSYWQFNLKQK